MDRLFVDTWGWLTLRDKGERRHQDIAPVFESFQQSNAGIYTSDFVLDETFTLLFRRLPFEAVYDESKIKTLSPRWSTSGCAPACTSGASARRALRRRLLHPAQGGRR
jgi:hypothetical protein